MNQDEFRPPNPLNNHQNRPIYGLGIDAEPEAQLFFVNHQPLYDAIDKVVEVIESNGFEVDLHIYRIYKDEGLGRSQRRIGLSFFNGDDDEDDDDWDVTDLHKPETLTFTTWLRQGIALFRQWWKSC